MIGYIVGSGFYDYEGLTEKTISTKWGDVTLKHNQEKALIFRHGKNHERLPHHVPYRANIAALIEIGCKAIISCSVVGVLNPKLKLGQAYITKDLYFPENRLPNGETCSFFNTIGEKGRGHLIAGSLFNTTLTKKITEILPEASEANYIYSIGPRFNTKIEIAAFQKVGGDIISQTCGPEAVLSNEKEIPYAMLTYAIDYANGVTQTPTSIDELNKNLAKSHSIFKKVIDSLTYDSTIAFENFVYKFE